MSCVGRSKLGNVNTDIAYYQPAALDTATSGRKRGAGDREKLARRISDK